MFKIGIRAVDSLFSSTGIVTWLHIPKTLMCLSGSFDDTDMYFCFILTVARVLSHQLMMAG